MFKNRGNVMKKNKNDLVDAIYKTSNMDKKDISVVVDLLFSEIKKSLEDGASIELRGFGTFEPRLRKGREAAINPKTGEKVKVEPHYVAAFRAGKELKANLWNLKIEEK